MSLVPQALTLLSAGFCLLSLRVLFCSALLGSILFFSFQKFRVDMPGSGSAFIPTINAITTSQDLQWMVQPTVITSMSNPYPRSHPYSPLPGLASVPGHMALPRPGVIKTIGTTVGRRRRDEQVQLRSAQKSHVGGFRGLVTRCFCSLVGSRVSVLGSLRREKTRGQEHVISILGGRGGGLISGPALSPPMSLRSPVSASSAAG